MTTEPAAAPTRRRRWRSILVVATVTVGVAAAAALGTGLWVQHSLGSQIAQLPSAMPTGGQRPAAESTGALNILLLGSDKRADGSIAGQRSDTMMVIHVDADRRGATFVSIPRDSWVDVPGLGTAKINAAFATGGPARAVQAVEDLTGLRMDHVAVIDWEGFKQVTDELGGVTLTIPKTVTNGYTGRVWKAGRHHMDGKTALAYVRQRAGLAGGDFDRVKRQQYFLRTLFSEALSRGTMTNPSRLYGVLDAVTSNLSVDEDWTTADLRDLAISLRSVRTRDITFTTIPVTGTGMEGAQSVVYVDRPAADELWSALRDDHGAQWAEEHDAALGNSVS